jgi:hypothetical protein
MNLKKISTFAARYLWLTLAAVILLVAAIVLYFHAAAEVSGLIQ